MIWYHTNQPANTNYVLYPHHSWLMFFTKITPCSCQINSNFYKFVFSICVCNCWMMDLLIAGMDLLIYCCLWMVFNLSCDHEMTHSIWKSWGNPDFHDGCVLSYLLWLHSCSQLHNFLNFRFQVYKN